MASIERIVDHLVVVASFAQASEISNLLEEAGFRLGDDAVEKNLGVRSRLFPIAGGGFIEVSCELSPGSFAHGNPFEITPRLMSVCYTTDDAAADIARWRGIPGTERAMAYCGSWRRQNGSMGYYVGVMPTPPVGEVFFSLQERRLFPLPYLGSADTAPVIQRVLVSGPDAELWRQRHAELFALPAEDGVLRAGKTDLAFEQAEAVRTEITVTIAVPNPKVRIPLLAGRFEFVMTKEPPP